MRAIKTNIYIGAIGAITWLLSSFQHLIVSEVGAIETIAEADKYSTTELMAGVVQEIIDVSPMFAILPVKTILGNSLTYNRENTLPTASFRSPGDIWTESTPVITPITAVLKIAGHDADVDNFLARTRSNQQDLAAEMIVASVKAVGRLVENELAYGDVDDIDVKGFDGMHEILGVVTGGQDVLAGSGTSGGPGSFSKLDQMIDLVKPEANALVMPRRTKRQMQKLMRAQGSEIALQQFGAFNTPIRAYGGLPILINDFLTITEDVVDGGFGGKTGDDTSSIFAIHMGAEGMHLLDSGPGIEIEDLGALETKDATRRRIKWYLSLALLSTKALARLSGIDTQDWTN